MIFPGFSLKLNPSVIVSTPKTEGIIVKSIKPQTKNSVKFTMNSHPEYMKQTMKSPTIYTMNSPTNAAMNSPNHVPRQNISETPVPSLFQMASSNVKNIYEKTKSVMKRISEAVFNYFEVEDPIEEINERGRPTQSRGSSIRRFSEQGKVRIYFPEDSLKVRRMAILRSAFRAERQWRRRYGNGNYQPLPDTDCPECQRKALASGKREKRQSLSRSSSVQKGLDKMQEPWEKSLQFGGNRRRNSIVAINAQLPRRFFQSEICKSAYHDFQKWAILFSYLRNFQPNVPFSLVQVPLLREIPIFISATNLMACFRDSDSSSPYTSPHSTAIFSELPTLSSFSESLSLQSTKVPDTKNPDTKDSAKDPDTATNLVTLFNG